MDVINKSMDAYEIAEHLFNDKFLYSNIDISTPDQDLKTYFEMLIIIMVEGLKKFFGDDNEQVNIENLSMNDFNKINEYLNHIHININLQIFDRENWEHTHKQNNILYNKIVINNTTKLEDLKFIIEKTNIYVINFNYKY